MYAILTHLERQNIDTVSRIYVKEVPDIQLPDGRKIIYLSTCGKNPAEVPEKLVKFLAFVKADLKESQNNFADSYVQKLQEFIVDVKKSREMEARFMILEEMLRDERNAGKTEGVKYTLLENYKCLWRNSFRTSGKN